jgi:hypothetical protein
MCGRVGLHQHTWKIFNEVSSFIPGANNNTNRMLLRPCSGLSIKIAKTAKKHPIVNQLNKCNCTENIKYDCPPVCVQKQFLHVHTGILSGAVFTAGSEIKELSPFTQKLCCGML